jgi:hypothetical protein
VLAAGPGIFVLEHDGSTKLDASGSPLSYRGGVQGLDLGEFNPPTAHDFDGDGQVDIALGASAGFTVLDRDLEPIYQYSMIDEGLTATTAFDFLGDGQAEAVYADKDEILFFDVAQQRVVMSWPHSGSMDYPVVADVDNDGSAEVVIVSGGVVDNSQFFPVWVPLHLLIDQQIERVLHDCGQIAVGDAVSREPARRLKLVVQRAAGGELHLEAIGGQRSERPRRTPSGRTRWRHGVEHRCRRGRSRDGRLRRGSLRAGCSLRLRGQQRQRLCCRMDRTLGQPAHDSGRGGGRIALRQQRLELHACVARRGGQQLHVVVSGEPRP